ncbi:TetR/AcrR family transcriptional regulator [Gordonia sp. GONU]|uniref:TetR/AcrR family transcriptional regulator n=1 Tax=Gordonia sp. GONU TaxID=2972949 RepID=UPI0021AC152C|nr:TetR/AcrR family transcriptional regulator [Gordonia sp. GONU]MCR8897473.1 TetR/AcrR family transcriptional regulator [Gordonia sp. GONU]
MGAPSGWRERRQQSAMLDISDTALDMFAEHGFIETTIVDVAQAAGVSERTFHRYFPTKGHAIAPALDAGWQDYVDRFASRPHSESVVDGLVDSLESVLDGPHGRRHATFLKSLPNSPMLAPAWLSVHDRCRAALQPVLARRLQLDPNGDRAEFVAACVIAANRVAVERWSRDPRQAIAATVRTCLDTMGPLLTPDPGCRTLTESRTP